MRFSDQNGRGVSNEVALRQYDEPRVPFFFNHYSGTGTVYLEGRNCPNQEWTQLDSAKGNGFVLVPRMNRYRVRASDDAVGLHADVTPVYPLKPL
jgi:hypothetical protein